MKTFSQFITEAPRSIWFHGASIKNLRSILKQGLIPDPRRKNWQDDPHASIYQPSRESYGGIYVTNNLMTAIGAPRDHNQEGREVIVIMELQPNTFYLDEDDVTGHLSAALGHISDNEYQAAQYWMMASRDDLNQELKDSAKRQRDVYIEKVLEAIEYKYKQRGKEIPSQLAHRLRELLPGVWTAALGRIAAHATSHKSNYDMKRYVAGVYGDRYWREEIPKDMFPTIREGELNFKRQVEQVTRTMRCLAVPSNDEWWATARISTPVGYSGSNKILSVIEVQDGRQYRPELKDPTKIIIHYGKPPQRFWDEWEQRVGGPLEVINNSR